jgi:hypothetical protein
VEELMKKSKLTFSQQTVRVLTDPDLRTVAGGGPLNTRKSCPHQCIPTWTAPPKILALLLLVGLSLIAPVSAFAMDEDESTNGEEGDDTSPQSPPTIPDGPNCGHCDTWDSSCFVPQETVCLATDLSQPFTQPYGHPYIGSCEIGFDGFIDWDSCTAGTWMPGFSCPMSALGAIIYGDGTGIGIDWSSCTLTDGVTPLPMTPTGGRNGDGPISGESACARWPQYCDGTIPYPRE